MMCLKSQILNSQTQIMISLPRKRRNPPACPKEVCWKSSMVIYMQTDFTFTNGYNLLINAVQSKEAWLELRQRKILMSTLKWIQRCKRWPRFWTIWRKRINPILPKQKRQSKIRNWHPHLQKWIRGGDSYWLLWRRRRCVWIYRGFWLPSIRRGLIERFTRISSGLYWIRGKKDWEGLNFWLGDLDLDRLGTHYHWQMRA